MKKIATLIIVLALASCGQFGTNNQPVATMEAFTVPTDWKTYSHDNFSIQYPSSWLLKENQMSSAFAIYAPTDSMNAIFTANANLTTENVKGKNMDLEKYTAASDQQLKVYVTNFNVISSKKFKDKQGEFEQNIFSGDQGSFHILFEQWYRIINEKAYILTFTTLKERWDKDHQLGEQILSTFSVKQ